MEQYLPAVITMGVREASESHGRVWLELAAGAAVHVIDRRTGRHRAWIVSELEDGYKPVQIGCRDLAARFGGFLELVRDGHTFEIVDHTRRDVVRGYLQWCPPDSIARLDAALQHASRRSKSGRRRMVDVWPTEIMPRPA